MYILFKNNFVTNSCNFTPSYNYTGGSGHFDGKFIGTSYDRLAFWWAWAI
jgi:hypothetical protein